MLVYSVLHHTTGSTVPHTVTYYSTLRRTTTKQIDQIIIEYYDITGNKENNNIYTMPLHFKRFQSIFIDSLTKYKKARLTKNAVLNQNERIHSAITPITTNSVRHLLGIEDPPATFKPVVQLLEITSEFVNINSDGITSNDFFWHLALSDGDFIVHGALVDSKLGDDLYSEGILSNYSFIRLESYHLQEMEGTTVIMISELTVLHNLHYTFGSPVWYNTFGSTQPVSYNIDDKGLIPQDVCNQFT